VREIPGDVAGRARAALDAHPSLPAGLHQRLIGLVGTVAPDTARSEPDAAQPLDRARPAAVGNATAAGTAGPVRAPLSSARAGDAPAAQPFGALVDAAGLIIVHPFIERFFDNSGIARPRPSELRAAELPRAAALLHLLATGEDEAPENELGFIKILLGLDLETPLPIAAGLVDAGDRGQAESLLGAVVAHWGALGNTSADGLRASFLRRCGLIREDENGYRLRVEPAPYDMLLRKLPWGTGLIKLPWMRRPIFTEWEPA
jgi:hypothetical protein